MRGLGVFMAGIAGKYPLEPLRFSEQKKIPDKSVSCKMASLLETLFPQPNENHMGSSNDEDSGQFGPVLIGAWLLRPDLNRIERDGVIVHLEPKAVAILRLLAERAGEPVTRQELLGAVWAGVVVSDDALTQVIIKLRKALGDSSRNPEYIQTIPKRGYRLLAPVGVLPADTKTRTVVGRYGLLLAVGLLLAGAVYVLVGRGTDEGASTSISVPDNAAFEQASIAVLPFEDLGQDSRGRNFARGVTADLATDLSRLPEIWVINPSLESDATIRARYLISGSVQHVPGRINVHVRLLESESRHQLWSERYDRPLDDLFDVQRAISGEIVRQLAIEVSTADRERLAKRYTLSIAAYEDFLRGQSELLLRQQAANDSARRWYRGAIEKDPNFARAYAGLALSYAADYRNQWSQDREQALRQAEETANTAQQIDPYIREVYWVLAYVDTQKKNMDAALAHVRKALELDRFYADAHALMGGINTYRGQPGLSIPQLREAMRLNPDAGYLYYLLLGRAYFFLGQNEQAVINLRESLSRNPDNLEARIYLSATAVAADDPEAAHWEVHEIHAIAPEFDLHDWLATYPMTDKAQLEYLGKTMRFLSY